MKTKKTQILKCVDMSTSFGRFCTHNPWPPTNWEPHVVTSPVHITGELFDCFQNHFAAIYTG